MVAGSINRPGGSEAVSLKVAEAYVESFGKLAKETNTVLLPSNLDSPSRFVAEAISIFDAVKKERAAK